MAAPVCLDVLRRESAVDDGNSPNQEPAAATTNTVLQHEATTPRERLYVAVRQR